MFGLQLAQGGVAKVANMMAAQAPKKLPQQALTNGAVYAVVRKVAACLGIRMTKQIFAGGVAKIIPVLGAVLSGGLTLATLLPMAKRLQKHLASLELTEPGHRAEVEEIIDAVIVDDVQHDEFDQSELIVTADSELVEQS